MYILLTLSFTVIPLTTVSLWYAFGCFHSRSYNNFLYSRTYVKGALKTIKLFGFPIFWFWAYLMKVIPEARHAHYFWYLRFYLSCFNLLYTVKPAHVVTSTLLMLMWHIGNSGNNYGITPLLVSSHVSYDLLQIM